jgi:Flp pilus assembly protein TadD
MTQGSKERLELFLGYLAADPGNPSLLGDTAQAAAAAGELAKAEELLQRLERIGQLSSELSALRGKIALETGRTKDAILCFERLMLQNPDDLALQISLAWALMIDRQFEASSALLSDDAVAVYPSAALLKTKLLHLDARFDDALSTAREGLRWHPQDPSLLGLSSVLAMDLEDRELARSYAIAAGDNPDGLTTLAILEIGEGNREDAAAKLERAVAKDPNSARAALGLGMVDLLGNRTDEALVHLRRGATLFGTHVGSWIAVGWAELLRGQNDEAESVFRRALELDRSFGETHGSIAVIEALKGNIEAARHAVQTARRLDPQGFAAMLAQVLLAASAGDEETAKSIFEKALSTPVDESGRTVNSLMLAMTDIVPGDNMPKPRTVH